MSGFADFDEKKSKEFATKFRKTEYMDLSEGVHTIRFLEKSKKHHAHFLGGVYVMCLGDGCPACENNKKISFESSREEKKSKGFRPRVERFYVNVLDKTVAKVCPKCEAVYKNTNLLLCEKDGEQLSSPAPLNKVRVFAKNRPVFEDIDVIASSLRFESGEVVPFTLYDYNLIVRGKGLDTTTTVSPRWIPGKEDEPVYNKEDLFDLSSVVPQLSREEMLDVMNGVSIKDVFAVRRATKDAERAVESKNSGDVVLDDEIKNIVDGLFKD